MANVFISHDSDDRQSAEEVRRWLVAEKHRVFLDQDPRDGFEVGEEWEQRLNERLRWADAVVCVVTSAFLDSKWCTYEVTYARAWGRRLLPVLAEPKVDHPLLRSAHHADLTEDPSAGRAVLVEALRRIDAGGGLGWADDRSPFPGLRAFEAKDHQVFFGRRDEVEKLAGLLRSPVERAERAVLLVVGPSGCGKSSLVRAGLLPVLAEEPGWWTLPPILPGNDPVGALARELAAATQQTVAQVHHQLDDNGLTGLADKLLPAVGPRRLLVVVDQFEELLTQTSREQRSRFAQLLGAVLGGPVQVVATLRPEFLHQLLVDPELAVLPTPRTHTLRPLRRDALRAVIEGPAKLAGITVDDDLVTRLVTDTDSGEALPLLAFTLSELAEGVRRGGQLSTARYDQLGGVQGALTRQANTALTDATAATGRRPEDVIAELLRLVTVDEQGRPTRWRVPRAELPKLVTQELDAFVTRRLLTTDKGNDNVVVVEVAHEAFLSAWPPLAQEIAKNVPALRAHSAIEKAATEWHNDGRKPVRLWERGQLAAAMADTGARIQAHDLVTDRVELSPTARVFLRNSFRRDRFRRGRAVTVLSVLLVLAVVAAGIAVVQQRAAEGQRNIAVSQKVAGQALQLRVTDSALAAQLSLAAYQLAHTTEARGSLLSTFAIPYATQLTDHRGTVHSVAFSPDGRTLATASANTTVPLWDVRDLDRPLRLGTLTGHTGDVKAVAFSPDGHTLATASADKTARLWDVSDPSHPGPPTILPGHTTAVYSVAFSPDGHTLTTAGADSTVRLWDAHDLHRLPSLLGTLPGYTSSVRSVAFSPDGSTLATASNDITTRLWNVRDPQHPSPLRILNGHTNSVYSVAFSHDGRTLATGSFDRTVRLWDLPGPIVAGHTDTVFSVAYSHDGSTLATASDDATARLWDVRDPYNPYPLGTLTGHTAHVKGVAYSPDRQILATASNDNTARLWDVHDPRNPYPLGTLTGHTGEVKVVAFSPDGRTLATGSDDNTARLWDVHDSHLLVTLCPPHDNSPLATPCTTHGNTVWSVAFSPDSRTLATASADGTAQLWDVHDPQQPSALSTIKGHTGTVRSVAFSPRGRILAIASESTVWLWEISDPHRLPTLLGSLRGNTGEVYSVAFSPDGRTLATAGYYNVARQWDVSDPRNPSLLGTLTGHTGTVFAVAFSPDGRTLATASNDKTALLWETDVNSVATRICRITPDITKDQWALYLPGLAYRPPCLHGAPLADR
ncbi:MAG: TIR domain-containing protein [Pseudonocardiaceae bacterium]